MHTFALSKNIGPLMYLDIVRLFPTFSNSQNSDYFEMHIINNDALPISEELKTILPTIYVYKFEETKKVNSQIIGLGKKHYFVEMRINYGKLLGNTGHYSIPVEFTKSLVIDTLIETVNNVITPLNLLKDEDWLLRRMDYSYDIHFEYRQILMDLIGYGYTTGQFKDKTKVYYNKKENLVESIYCKSKSVHINIYDKLQELDNKNIPLSPIDIDRTENLLRFEVQVLRNRLYYMIKKENNNGNYAERKLPYFLKNDLEFETIERYVGLITGKGNYYYLPIAKEIVNSSNHKQNMKDKLCKVLDYVAIYHGIDKFLERVNKGIIKDCGNIDTAKSYLKKLHELGVNPVTISRNQRKQMKQIKLLYPLPDLDKYKYGIDFLYNPYIFFTIQYQFAEHYKYDV